MTVAAIKYYAPIDMTDLNKIIGMGDPTEAQDAVTKGYVDPLIAAAMALVPATSGGDLLVGAAGAANATDAAGLEKIATGTVETVVSGCDLIYIGTLPAAVPITIGLWTSQNNYGTSKTLTVRLRRTSITGTIIQTWTIAGSVDDVTGHRDHTVATLSDATPTDGHYLLTVQEDNAGNEVWSDTRTFAVGAIGLVVLSLGDQGELLTVVNGVPAWVPDPAASLAWNEVPDGAVNGSNPTFTLAHAPQAGALMLFKNGMLQRVGSGNDYTIASLTITFETGNIPQADDVLLSTYPW